MEDDCFGRHVCVRLHSLPHGRVARSAVNIPSFGG